MICKPVAQIIDTFTSQSSSHVAVQFNFDVRANTHYVKHTASKYQKRGSVVKATSSEPPAQIASKAKMGKLASYRARGSSRRIDDNLSCAECWKHMTNGGGRHDFILIPDVQVLMRMLPQPLGFARDALGVPTMTSYDRAICKLIWAELNILATQRSEGKSWRMRSALTLRRWLGLDVPIPSETGQVTFDETFLTLFHWRCPELVPEEVRKMREPMLEEVAASPPVLRLCAVWGLFVESRDKGCGRHVWVCGLLLQGRSGMGGVRCFVCMQQAMCNVRALTSAMLLLLLQFAGRENSARSLDLAAHPAVARALQASEGACERGGAAGAGSGAQADAHGEPHHDAAGHAAQRRGQEDRAGRHRGQVSDEDVDGGRRGPLEEDPWCWGSRGSASHVVAHGGGEGESG